MSPSPAQRELRVTFLGPLASFSHQAALDLFPTSPARTITLLPKPSFADAFAAIQSTEADYAVIPFENSTNGSVVQTLDLLADRDSRYNDIVVCGEYYLTVHHCLLIRNEDAASDISHPETIYRRISRLYTHPQAWGQCEAFLSKYFRGTERQDAPSTSKAANIVAKSGSNTLPGYGGGGGGGAGQGENGNNGEGISAAIASSLAAAHHNLCILAANIEDRADNTTRFLVLRNGHSEKTRDDEQDFYPSSTIAPTKVKSLISFMIAHETPGALVDALTIFRRHGLNLTSIVSRPGQIRPWQYIFFVECERVRGVHEEDVVEKAMEELEGKTSCCRDLGSWGDRLGR
ncbi:chorismate mutase/prephenate dehydratase [Histoplasma capsulatum var. duboisii H88]|uniref:prephenate dehydratase n=2 Tax=Ajellomyces capsulatus TaxID=5037 RepID=F0UG76_AJEC8|nr:chorismate mutase/prephenate dehydratase [Histoplasma capsulatum H143]EGC45071.1 chorismate mutase/prephenate dehydratase [Histoplasma capsulatum var. duboisii H88]